LRVIYSPQTGFAHIIDDTQKKVTLGTIDIGCWYTIRDEDHMLKGTVYKTGDTVYKTGEITAYGAFNRQWFNSLYLRMDNYDPFIYKASDHEIRLALITGFGHYFPKDFENHKEITYSDGILSVDGVIVFMYGVWTKRILGRGRSSRPKSPSNTKSTTKSIKLWQPPSSEKEVVKPVELKVIKVKLIK
jgi:hypothetical protein